jgi:hypothetical protein
MQETRIEWALLRGLVALVSADFMCGKVQQKALSFNEAR